MKNFGDPRQRETYYELELNEDDYSQRVYPLIQQMRKDLVALFSETKDVNRYLAFLLMPEFEKTEKQMQRLEKLLYDRFFDENKPIP